MKINKKFNQLSLSEYYHYIDNYKKYTDFNTLGLYRSILENDRLSLADQIKIRDYANQNFEKTFNFLQLKDPLTFFKLSTLGQELTEADRQQFWENIRLAQQKILADKKIKHRNFGDYSKHNCGYDWCHFNGLMIKQGSRLAESVMRFHSDKSKSMNRIKSEEIRKQRKNKSKIIQDDLDRDSS